MVVMLIIEDPNYRVQTTTKLTNCLFENQEFFIWRYEISFFLFFT